MDESKIIESYNEGVAEIISMMKELNIGLISQVNSLNQEIKTLREENLSLISRNAELEAKAKKNSKIVVNHHQLIIIKTPHNILEADSILRGTKFSFYCQVFLQNK